MDDLEAARWRYPNSNEILIARRWWRITAPTTAPHRWVAEKPDIIQEETGDLDRVEDEPRDSDKDSPGYPAVDRTRSDTLTPLTELEQPGSMPKQLEGDDVEEWLSYIHLEGWYYFFRQHHDKLDPGNIHFHEICGARENIKTTDTGTTTPKSVNKLGGLRVQTYVDHTRMFALEDKNELLKESYTDEEG